MKTWVSIPDDIFNRAEGLARRTKKTRSRLFTDAIREFVARHSPQDVTEAMDKVYADLEDPAPENRKDKFISSAAHRVLERSQW